MRSPKFDAHTAAQLIKRPKVFGPIAAIIGLLLVWWLAWMSPEASKLSSVRAQQASLELQQATLQAQLDGLKLDLKHLHRVNAIVYTVDNAIPSLPQSAQLVNQLFALAKSSGVSLSSVDDTSVVPANGSISTMPVSIAVNTAPGAAVIRFVDGLYTLPRLLTVQSLSLSGSGRITDVDAGSFSATIAATAYTTYGGTSSTAGTQGQPPTSGGGHPATSTSTSPAHS
jgi:Tfp pilus assembly protein PilO